MYSVMPLSTGVAVEGTERRHAALPEELQQGCMACDLLHRR